MTDRIDVLVVDDQASILEDFRHLLAPGASAEHAELDALASLLGAEPVERPSSLPSYELHLARQGIEALALHGDLLAQGRRTAVAFVDIQMPPGIDGIETLARLWEAQPDLEAVLCTAYSDYTWHSILDRLERRDQLVILRKPFDPIEVHQLAACLSEKWKRGRMLARRMEQLEEQVREEVARRLDVELRNAQKFEALGRLAAGIAHEINTPSQYIQTSLESIDEVVREVDTALAAGDLAVARRVLAHAPPAVTDALQGVKRVTAIVRSMREYAHTRQGAAPEPFDVEGVIRTVTELVRAQYKHDATFLLELGGIPQVVGDADELGRALVNLLVNAAQAVMATGKRGTITVRTSASDDDITIAVVDTGVGIPREHRDRVFELFFTTKPRGEGTGQGLAMARSVIAAHGGTVTFDSAPGHGTTFYIRLPRQQRKEAAA